MKIQMRTKDDQISALAGPSCNANLALEEENLERVSNLNDVVEKEIREGILERVLYHQRPMIPQQLQVVENMETHLYLPDANLPRYSRHQQVTKPQQAR